MHCREAQEWMSLRLDGRLSREEWRQLEAHFVGCLACREAWSRWQEIESLFAGAPMARLAEDLTARVLERIGQRSRRGALWGSLMVMVLGLVVLGMVFVLPPVVGVCGLVMTTAQSPGMMAIAASVAANGLEIVATLAEVGRLLLWATLSPRSAVVALAHAALAAVSLMGWLRLVVFRGARAESVAWQRPG